MKRVQLSPYISIRGVRIDNLNMTETLECISNALHSRSAKKIAFVNADCINIAARNKEYQKNLQQMDMILADGIGMRMAGKLLKRPIIDNVNGTDLFPMLCEALNKTKGSIYLLGARPSVAEKVSQWIQARYPEIRIAGKQHGYYEASDESRVCQQIRESRPDVLLVAMGAPLQEKWITRNMEKTGAIVVMGVGGLFDFYSGRIPRAPQWMRHFGMEWVYRFIQEPGRMWKRYLIGNFTFLIRIIAEYLKLKIRQEAA